MTVAQDQLRSIIERIENLEAEKKAIADDIRDLYAEAKSSGYDVKALRTIVKMRKQDADERREQEAIVENYAHALGMLADTPLGEAAIERAASEARPAKPAARKASSSEQQLRDRLTDIFGDAVSFDVTIPRSSPATRTPQITADDHRPSTPDGGGGEKAQITITDPPPPLIVPEDSGGSPGPHEAEDKPPDGDRDDPFEIPGFLRRPLATAQPP